jgi:hypothetical protein
MLMDDATWNYTYDNYTVSAAYDQGSTIGKVMKRSDVLSCSFPNKVAEYVVANPILVASELAIIPASWIILKWRLSKRLKKIILMI